MHQPNLGISITRLRPILIASVIGLLRMALKLGEGSESYAPLALALPAGFYLAYRVREIVIIV